MKWLVVAVVGCVALVSAANLGVASDRTRTIYRISEKSAEDVDSSPYLLTVSSNNLKQYPRSIVTFLVTTDLPSKNRSIASAAAGAEQTDASMSSVPKLRAKRHYTLIQQDEFGRSGKTHVSFDRKNGTVFLDFVGKGGKTFYFKEVTQR